MADVEYSTKPPSEEGEAEISVPLPPPPPEEDPRVAYLRAKFEHDLALLDEAEAQVDKGNPFKITTIVSSFDVFVGANTCVVDAEDSAPELTSSLTVSSAVRSYNRSIDSYNKAPMYLVRGSPKIEKSHSGYTRMVEMVGDMRPNLLVAEADGSEKYYKVAKSTTVDLSGVDHYIMNPALYEHHSGFQRFNLFNGQVLAVGKHPKTDISQIFVANFTNIRELGHSAAGLQASAKWEKILPFLTSIRQPQSEYVLLTSAVKTAIQAKREPDIEFYRYPTEWLKDNRLPPELRTYLEQLHGSPITLPKFPEDSGSNILKSLLRALDERKDYFDADTKELYEVAKREISQLSEEDKDTLYDQLANEPIIMGGDAAKEYTGEIAPKYLTSDQLPDNYLEVISAGNPAFRLHRHSAYLEVNFEGLSYWANFDVRGKYLSPNHPALSLEISGGSARLNECLHACSNYFMLNVIAPIAVEFDVTLNSQCKSIVTRRRKAEHGYGIAKMAPIWNERLSIEVHYQGIWLVAIDKKFLAWTTRINNQIFGEFVHATAQPGVIRIKRNSSSALLTNEADDIGNYLDSPDIRGGVVLRPVHAEDWNEPPSLPAICSGLGRVLPPQLLALAIANRRITLPNVEDFLRGRDVLYFQIQDSDGSANIYRYEDTLNLKVPPMERGVDWWNAMTKTVNTANRANALSDEGNTSEPEQDVPIPPPARPTRGNHPNRGRGRGNAPTRASARGRGRGRGAARAAIPEPVEAIASTSEIQPTTIVDRAGMTHALRTAPGVLVNDPATWPQPPQKPTPTVEFEFGDWLCKAVQQLPVEDRRYVASRCLDWNNGSTDLTGYISPTWKESLLNYVHLPTASQPISTKRNWYIPYDSARGFPEVFRYTSWEEDEPLPDVPHQGRPRKVPGAIRTANKEMPHWVREGKGGKPSIFL